MEFLIRTELSLPAEMDPAARAELLADESARGRALRDQGVIVRIWRIPGRRASLAIWQASDATELHDLLSSLPVFPWLQVEVQPLARHYLESEEGHQFG